MNQRFKLLALEAGEHVNSVYTPPVRSKTPGKIWEDGHIGWNEKFQEKFAELIVRECIEVVKWSPSLFSTDEYVKNIEEHFGLDYRSNILAGAEVVDDFGGYEESTLEKQQEFAKNRNYKYE